MVVMFVISKAVDPVHLERAVVFMQASLDLDVMALMFPYRFGVLDAVSLLVLIIFQYVIVAIFANVSRDVRISDAMSLRLLIAVVLVLPILRDCRSGTHHCEHKHCEN